MADSEYLLNTDTGHDKVTFDIEDSFTALARYSTFSFRRTVTTKPNTQQTESMPEGIWSLDNTTWYPMGVTPPNTSGAQPTFQTYEVDCYCNASTVFIVCTNFTASNQTIYYAVRLIARN